MNIEIGRFAWSLILTSSIAFYFSEQIQRSQNAVLVFMALQVHGKESIKNQWNLSEIRKSNHQGHCNSRTCPASDRLYESSSHKTPVTEQ